MKIWIVRTDIWVQYEISFKECGIKLYSLCSYCSSCTQPIKVENNGYACISTRDKCFCILYFTDDYTCSQVAKFWSCLRSFEWSSMVFISMNFFSIYCTTHKYCRIVPACTDSIWCAHSAHSISPSSQYLNGTQSSPQAIFKCGFLADFHLHV